MRGLKWFGVVVAYYVVAFILLICLMFVAERAADASKNDWYLFATMYGIGFAILPILLVPSLIARWRRLPTWRRVLLFNVTLGFTGIGWFAALAYAILSNRKGLGLPIVIANTDDNPVRIRQV
jgi:hypothetical protein